MAAEVAPVLALAFAKKRTVLQLLEPHNQEFYYRNHRIPDTGMAHTDTQEGTQ